MSTSPDRPTSHDRSVIVVSGLPRSGTSMVMRMLQAGGLDVVDDGLRAPDEDNPGGYYEFTPVKSMNQPGEKLWLADAQGKVIKIVSFFLPHLPDGYHYRIIFIDRRLGEVLASQKKMLTRRGEKAGDAASDTAMAGMFTTHLTKVKQLLASRANCEVLYVDHRETIDAPARVAAEIDGFLGGRLDTAAMTAVVDQQLHRNRV